MVQPAFSSSHPHHGPARARTKPMKKRGISRLVAWEWAIVLALLSGLGVTILMLSQGPDPKNQAAALVEQMKAAAQGRPLGAMIFASYPAVQRTARETLVSVDKIPPKVCVLASWDLYRLGPITINGTAPQRVSAAKLVELCNDGELAALTWATKTLTIKPHP
jgi:hypothetical protein